MKKAYLIVLSPDINSGYSVFVPDFNINTQGESIVDAIEMARDAISIVGIDMEDRNKSIPSPSESVKHNSGDILTYVDVDFDSYRRKFEKRTVRRTVTIPAWIDAEARNAGINVSAILKEALIQELDLSLD